METQESFGEFITRILHEKKLTLSDVEKRTQKAISDSYLSYLTQDKGSNLTLTKLKALAEGLGVPEAMVLGAASGLPLIDATTLEGTEFAHLMYKYDQLSDLDKTELRPTLKLLCREIERRLGSLDNNHPVTREAVAP